MIMVMMIGIILSILIVCDVGLSIDKIGFTYCPAEECNGMKKRMFDDTIGISEEETKDCVEFESFESLAFESLEEVHFSTQAENVSPDISEIAAKIGKLKRLIPIDY